ncbi:MAG: PHP domain-containing protein [Clostridiales bacterium]|nr:PHP domain-containing protein [Clostridiales bacterium]
MEKCYKIKYDYHTHTYYSHGKGRIEDNVRAADKKGLAGIAIADHGPGHIFYGIDREEVRSMRNEIEMLRRIYARMDIFLSVEANITDTGSGLDIEENELKEYDFLIAGYHFGIRRGHGLRNFIDYYSPFELPGRSKLMRKNTDMAVKAIYENPVKILAHPGDKGLFDMVEIAKACADRGTYLEINDQHGYMTTEAIRQAAKTDVQFIISSDAHTPEKVGSCEQSIKRALEADIDMNRIVNIVEC